MSNTLEAKLKLDIAELVANQAKARQETKKWIDDLRSEGKRGAQAMDGIAQATRRAGEFAKAGQQLGRLQLGGVAMQAQDIAVQLQMGTKASIVLAQQGSQILSSFGAGGAVAGGVLALGGIFGTLADKAKDNFAAMKADAETFGDRMKASFTGSSAEITRFFADVRAEVKTAYSEIERLQSGWSGIGARVAALFGGPSVGQQETTANALAIQKANALAQIQQQVLLTSAQETRIAEMKAAGHEKAAEALQRQLALQQQIAQIEASQLDAAVKKQLIQDATKRTQLAGVTPVDAVAERKKKQKAEEQLAELKRSAQDVADELLPDDQRLNALKEKLQDLFLTAALRNPGTKVDTVQKMGELAGRATFAAPVNEYKQALDLQRQIAALQKSITDDATRAAERAKDKARQDQETARREADRATAANERRRSAVLDTQDEFNMLKARGTLRKGDDEKERRKSEIRRRREELMANNGLDYAEANELATRMQDMQDRADNGGRAGRIRGYTRGQYSTKAAQSRGFTGLAGANRGLSAYDRLQRGTSAYDALQRGTSAYDALQSRHQQNAAQSDQRGTRRDTFGGGVDKLIEELPPRIAEALVDH
jgi:hypothetical protein